LKTIHSIHTVLLISALFVALGGACNFTPTMPAPPRDFQPIDLIVDEDGLPPGWSVFYQREEPFNALGFRKNLGGGSSRLNGEESNADHIIAYFRNSKDAKRAYDDHNHTRDSKGNYAWTWTPLPDFSYESEIAGNFRVMCATIANTEIRLGQLCVIEAQYEEFLSVLIYRTGDASRAVDEITFLANAIDNRIGKALGRLE
jgi:hypothetical protein